MPAVPRSQANRGRSKLQAPLHLRMGRGFLFRKKILWFPRDLPIIEETIPGMELIEKIKKSSLSLPFLSKLLKGKSNSHLKAASTCVVCDFGKSKIVVLEIEKSAQGLKLLKFQKTSRVSSQGKDADALKEFFAQGGFSSKKVRMSVKGQGVIIRFVQFPQMKEADLRSAISFEIDQYIPFKSHEVVWDFSVIEDNIPLAGGAGMNVLLVAMKREELYAMIQTFQTAGLEIELIDVDALASINALEYFQPEDIKTTAAILDIGTEVSTLSVVHGGKPKFIRDMTYGGIDILKRLRRKLGLTQEAAFQQIEVDREPTPEAAAVIKEALGDLVSDLKISLNYYLDQVPGAETVKKLFIAGGGGYHPLVIETLSRDLGIPVEVMNVTGKVQLGENISQDIVKQNQGMLPVALGLCLR